MASEERESITGSEAEPPAGTRGRALGAGQGDEAPLKLKALLSIFIQKRGQELRIYAKRFEIKYAYS